MELMIDRKPCDLGSERCLIPGFDAAVLSDPDAARSGRSLKIVIPRSPQNDKVLYDAAYPHAGNSFNKSFHTAELSDRGACLIGGTVRLLAVTDQGYRIEIREGGAQWAENTARRMLNTLGVDWSKQLTPSTVVESWTDNNAPVKFLPILRDEYEQQNSSSDLLPAERILSVDDYHPFLHLATLLKTMFDEAGYTVRSNFLDSNLFQTLFMSGAYASRDTTAAVNRMGFAARRIADASAVANEVGRVLANPSAVANSVGNIVDTATPESVDADGVAISGLFNNGNCFSKDQYGKICFTPPTEITVGFEYYLKYTTDHRILSRSRLAGFDTVYLGPGSEFAFQLTNRYADLRQQIEPDFIYRVIVFDHVEGNQYRLLFTRNGVPETLWTSFAARSAQVTTPAGGSVEDPVLQVYQNGQWVSYADDWALYNGYIGETGQTTVEIRLRSASESVSPSSPKFFNLIYFGGAESGMSLTLHKETSLRPRFLAGPGFGSTVAFEDVARHSIRQAEVIKALIHLFNLKIFTEQSTKTVWIEPADDFFAAGPEVDWSDRTDFAQPVECVECVTQTHELRTWCYQEGNGPVARFDAEADTPLGAWSCDADSLAALQGEEVLRNPLFRPSLSVTGRYLNAPDAFLLQVGDRDNAEEDGTNFTPRIVRFFGMHPLPAGQRWGFPWGQRTYPLAVFHFPGDDNANPFTLCFEDRDGAAGLHQYYDRDAQRDASRQLVSLSLRIEPHEFAALFSPDTGMPEIRSRFRINVGTGVILATLQSVDDYDPVAGTARCSFLRTLED